VSFPRHESFDRLTSSRKFLWRSIRRVTIANQKLDLVEPRVVRGSVVKDEAFAVVTTPLAEEGHDRRVSLWVLRFR
jgi:hypothetical protein